MVGGEEKRTRKIKFFSKPHHVPKKNRVDSVWVGIVEHDERTECMLRIKHAHHTILGAHWREME
jgi:hypothetical protein